MRKCVDCVADGHVYGMHVPVGSYKVWHSDRDTGLMINYMVSLPNHGRDTITPPWTNVTRQQSKQNMIKVHGFIIVVLESSPHSSRSHTRPLPSVPAADKA